MSVSFFTETILTLVGPALFVGGVWALAVWALNLPDAQTRRFHHLLSPHRRISTPPWDRSSAPESKCNVAKLKGH